MQKITRNCVRRICFRPQIFPWGILTLFFILSSFNLCYLSAFGAEILSFSPEGTIKGVQQVKATFSEPMQAFGDARTTENQNNTQNDPFQITCTAPGHGRWADATNWIYDFNQELSAGIQCQFQLKAGLKSLAGSPLVGRTRFSFDTGGPSIHRSEPWEGSNQVDEQQIFILTLDAEVNPTSVLQHAYFSIAGIHEKIPVTLLDQDPRKKEEQRQLQALKKKIQQESSQLQTTPSSTIPLDPVAASREKPKKTAEIILKAKRKFPPNTLITLVWGKGIKTPTGASTQTDQTLSFTVRPEFSAEFTCERESSEAACTPLRSMNVYFNAPISGSAASKIRLREKNSTQHREWKPFETTGKNYNPLETLSHISFREPFPEKTQFELTLPSHLKDDAGRPLLNASRFPLMISTAELPPLLKFPTTFGILELNPEVALPVTVRNIETPLNAIQGQALRIGAGHFSKTVQWLLKVVHAKREVSLFAKNPQNGSHTNDLSDLHIEPLTLPRPNSEKEFEVIGIPLKKPGFYIVEFKSERLGSALLGKPVPMYVPTAALVTNLSVHFKHGLRESSLVWVTSLDQGKPVAGAHVAVQDCQGTQIASALTNEQGIATISSPIPEDVDTKCNHESEYSEYSRGLYITAEKDDDFSFVHSSWQKGIEPWRFNVPGGYALTPEFASTVFDRTLFRAGEIVHMKHFFRKHSSKGIEQPKSESLPNSIRIQHQESNQTYEFPLTWRNGSISETTWTIPKSAKLGTYTVSLLSHAVGKGDQIRVADLTQDQTWPSGKFRVEEFRIPLMRGQIKPPAKDLIAPQEVPFDVSVEYLSGGMAAKLPIQVRYQTFISYGTDFPEFQEFSIGRGQIKDQLRRDELTQLDHSRDSADASASQNNSVQHLQLDKAGTGRVIVPLSNNDPAQIKRLHIELDYRDPNGETQTVSSTVPIYASSRLIGIKPNSWFATKNAIKFQVAVLDLQGKAISNAPVEVHFIEQKYYSHRKRLIGGLYSYENKTELKPHGLACQGTTDQKGLLECESQSPISGNLILEAKTIDEANHPSFTYASTWVYESGESWFAQEDSDRIDLLPEQKHYEVGNTATFQVRMPFREALALVTVEREGVIDSFVTPLSGQKPLIEVPIKSNYAPNVFISALVIRGRIGDVQPTAMIDLGKPAYKLGITEINVGWKPHELKVQVQPSKPVYQIREKGRFHVHVKTADGSPLPQGSEIALAAVDEGLLQLKANDSWQLLDNMMQQRSYEMRTYTSQSEVIGKRHFGLKALPFGGDGGKSPARELFGSLLYWNGNITLDSNGEADIQFPMNDSITGFKIAAIAHAGSHLFGTGYATIRTTQDLMILSGIPPLAREGDHMPLELTLRNTTEKPMKLQITGHATGIQDLNVPHLALAPNESKQLKWPVSIPNEISSVQYQISAKDQQSSATDQIRISQKVIPAIPVRTLQATLASVDPNYQLPIETPKDALPNRGSIRVILNSTLLTGLEGVRDYMSTYPYSCLEQRTSKAIALRDQKLWQSVVDDLPNYLDSDGLAKFFPSDWLQGSDILTSYVLSISHESGWNLPEDIRNKMIQGLSGFIEGHIVRISDLPTADLTIRKLAALEAISRYNAAHWAMTGSLQIAPNLWPTSAVINWLEILKRIQDIPAVEAKRKEVDQILRSRLNFQGTLMTFSSEESDQLWWMMVSPSMNANRFLLSIAEDPLWKADVAKIARGTLLRQKRGHWDTTPANAWGVLALEKFSRLFEKTAVTGTTTATLKNAAPISSTLNESTQGVQENKPQKEQPEQKLNWSATIQEKIFDFEWPQKSSSLSITHSGAGKPWVTIQSRAATPLKEPFSSGYKMIKTMKPEEQKTPGKWSQGDIVRVRLELESQSDMTWVVVNDPIPAGSMILGSGLGNDSTLSTTSEKTRGFAEPAFQERAWDGYRAYFQYVPKGKWMVEYTLRLNQSGQMSLPPTRVEAMYAPEMFGEIPNETISIAE